MEVKERFVFMYAFFSATAGPKLEGMFLHVASDGGVVDFIFEHVFFFVTDL